MQSWIPQRFSRRGVLSGGVLAAGGVSVAALIAGRRATAQATHVSHDQHGLAVGHQSAHGHMITVGDVDTCSTTGTGSLVTSSRSRSNRTARKVPAAA